MDVLVLATTNAGKAREVAAILAQFGIDVEVPDALPEVEETGATFAENAALKARSAAAALGRPTAGEDSGLVVEALDGAPGVRSARYAGEDATDAANNARLLRELAARGLETSPAAFVCHVALAAPDGRILHRAEGRVEGVVGGPPRGEHGFGYDPLFLHPPSGCRLAELPPEAKNAISHRAEAFRALARRLRPG